MATKVFKGANVFMSRNLVPPELFDALHDALKLNGAQVLLCCDPSRNGPNDYHVIASPEHEKFDDLRSKGCNLIGPQCVLSCAKEHRVPPNQGFTCCLAMDGVNILASGFEKDEKADIAKMVTAMGGVLHTKASSDVNFVIAKNVLAQKYKWALNNLKKPIVTTNWLLQCWKEHRVVPQEPYKVLPFSGLTICVSGIPSGDKYKVAKRWGHIYIVYRKWFHQSVARRACLSEESYHVQGTFASSVSSLKTSEQHSRGKVIRNSQYSSSSMATASDSETNFSVQDMETELETPLPNTHPTFVGVPPLPKEGEDPPDDENKHDSDFARCIADDSQCEDDDLYLSECRVLLVGFDASELRKLVDMVRQGGGSRYMSFNQKLTHVVVGNPSETETKEVRSLAALGVIYIVKTTWLEECTFKKKEVPVLQSHIAYDLLLPKDPITFNKTTATSMTGSKQGKSSISQTVDDVLVAKSSQFDVSFGLKEEAKLKMHSGRPEIVLWINEGGGEVAADQNEKNVHFIIERHGAGPSLTSTDGYLLDASSHILYSPLLCEIPLPGFERYRICVSRYEVKERKLLRNLCYVLGIKFIEKLTKKVTHLLCKFADGDKYEAACRWGIHVVTAEWIYECATQYRTKLLIWKGFTLKSSPLKIGKKDYILLVNEETYSLSGSKRARVLRNDSMKRSVSCESTIDNSLNLKNPTEYNVTENSGDVSIVPDVAAAIEDLLEQTSKFVLDYEQFLFSNSTMLGQRHADQQSIPGPSKNWLNRIEKRDDNTAAEAAATNPYDGFSETQTDSQVVGYEEDLTGRQMIIDRVRTRGSRA
ncbi:DNA topoisomerase 2-binding protein 1 [Phtheirospermum japonicum]|uniref:DNA topoisomerase 2-binding protein 1 n=1 Tax=Phtheirospermum japonicum TaxID=374723 RepID=A0A830CJ23_9LAMI|nr:DNA topoisomerase 2-binding protein 1 [Phtheirospermum japonicum]